VRVKELVALLRQCNPDDYAVIRTVDGFFTIEGLVADMVLSGSEKGYTFLVTMPTAEYTINHQP